MSQCCLLCQPGAVGGSGGSRAGEVPAIAGHRFALQGAAQRECVEDTALKHRRADAPSSNPHAEPRRSGSRCHHGERRAACSRARRIHAGVVEATSQRFAVALWKPWLLRVQRSLIWLSRRNGTISTLLLSILCRFCITICTTRTDASRRKTK